MLKTTTYLVEQNHSVVYTTIGSTPNRNMTMYARNLKVYKGVKNPLGIEIKNNDQISKIQIKIKDKTRIENKVEIAIKD